MITNELLKYVDKATPVEDRIKAANLPEELTPAHQLTVTYYLTKDENPQVKKAADATLRSFPTLQLMSALTEVVDPLVIKEVASAYEGDDTIIMMCALNTQADEVFVMEVALKGSEAVVTALIEESDRFQKNPSILEAIKKNPYVPASIIQTATEMISGTYVKPEQALETSYDNNDETNINKMIQTMTIGEKIKFAMTGNKEARGIFLKEANKMIIAATLKNPRITEDEIMQLALTKGTSDDTLRQISRGKEWMKNYQIKYALVTNAKTPITISMSLINQLYLHDLKKLAKSKSIPSVIAATAKKVSQTKKQ